jgi:CheY-like chemotaxis protein
VNYDTVAGRLRFKISDTGYGISREVRERLFRPFSQGDNTSTRRFGGTGLGLVLSQKLAQALGGNVKLLFSELGRGSIFEVVLPTRAQEVSAPSEKVSGEDHAGAGNFSGALKGRRILLVEDSLDNQEIFTLFLQRAGATVDLAKSGDEALIKAGTYEYDIILMDIQLPIVDGKQATRILRKRGWKKPIIALTAHALEEEKLAVAQAGCDGQITKPVAGTALVFAVKRYLERSEKQIG